MMLRNLLFLSMLVPVVAGAADAPGQGMAERLTNAAFTAVEQELIREFFTDHELEPESGKEDDSAKSGKKNKKAKEEAPIPQKLVQEIKIEIKDSVINRSNIGSIAAGGGAAAKQAADYCLSCGKDLPGGFKGKHCPHCGDEL